MSRVAVATSSAVAAAAGAEVADAGGNAVDAAVASSIVTLFSEPGICSVGAGAYVTVWPASGDPVTIDGNVEMPGRGLAPDRFGRGCWEITTGYAGGTTTLIGHGTVGTPGALATLDLAAARYGTMPWRELLQPAISLARRGFPVSTPVRHYLEFVHEVLYGWEPASRAAIHDADGVLLEAGATIVLPDLVASLERLAEAGAADLYTGDLAAIIAADSEANDGILTATDLAAYEVVVRPALTRRVADWELATNPAPAIGGAALLAMLVGMNGRPAGAWTAHDVRHLAEVQHAVLSYRRQRLDLADDVAVEIAELLDAAEDLDLRRLLTAPSTVQTTASDADGVACSVTASAGYGSGVMPPGTGFWMNNCLGELELNRRGLHAIAPGTRLPSNMAPTVARRWDGATLAIGSPGADRITTALLQTLAPMIHAGVGLADAVALPRLHVDVGAVGDEPTVSHEPGLPVEDVTFPTEATDGLAMYFGGVTACLTEPGVPPTAAADPRRTGATATGG